MFPISLLTRDNYAFVTFRYTCDAFAAIEGVNEDTDQPEYDICFGGRRQFCRSDYADLGKLMSSLDVYCE